MSLSPEAIDRIVANVLKQLGSNVRSSGVAEPIVPKPVETPTTAVLHLSERVITGTALEGVPVGATVTIAAKAIVTPAAHDVAKVRRLQLVKGDAASVPLNTNSAKTTTEATCKPLLIVVKNSQSLEKLWEELSGSWRRELVGCPDDAAKLAISELSRGGNSVAVIFSEQSHRVACLANRNEQVKAVAVRDAGDVRLIRRQIRANTWCVDNHGKTYFELKNIIREIQSK